MLTSLLGPAERLNIHGIIHCTVKVFDDTRQLAVYCLDRLLVGPPARRSRCEYQHLPKSSGDDLPFVTESHETFAALCTASYIRGMISSMKSVSSQTTWSATMSAKGKMRLNRSRSPDGIWSCSLCNFKS